MPCKQVGSVTDPDTGDTIEIYQINPDDQCRNEFDQWLSDASQPGGEIEQCMKEKCPQGPYTAKWKYTSYSSTGVHYCLHQDLHYDEGKRTYTFGYYLLPKEGPDYTCIPLQVHKFNFYPSDEEQQAISDMKAYVYGQLYKKAEERAETDTDTYEYESNGCFLQTSGSTQGYGSAYASWQDCQLMRPDGLDPSITGAKCCYRKMVMQRSGIGDCDMYNVEEAYNLVTLNFGQTVKGARPKVDAQWQTKKYVEDSGTFYEPELVSGCDADWTEETYTIVEWVRGDS